MGLGLGFLDRSLRGGVRVTLRVRVFGQITQGWGELVPRQLCSVRGFNKQSMISRDILAY